MRIGGCEGLAVDKIDIRDREIRIESDSFAISVQGLRQSAERLQRVADIVVDLGKIGFQRQRAAIMRQRGVGSPRVKAMRPMKFIAR